MVGGLALAERSGRRIPERVGVGDLVLMGVATHKLSRLITKDRVTSFARAPFTRYEEPAGHGEIEEHARGTGMRRAVGQLLTCPYCISQWVAGGLHGRAGRRPAADPPGGGAVRRDRDLGRPPARLEGRRDPRATP